MARPTRWRRQDHARSRTLPRLGAPEHGRRAEARDLHQDTLDRAQQVLGWDHPYTLTYASEVAIDLHDVGEVKRPGIWHGTPWNAVAACWAKTTRNTLRFAGNLARDLSDLGELQVARDLNYDTLKRMRRVLGEDHPDTLSCARNLASNLHGLGELQAARDLDQETLERFRRVLGEDHPDTLGCAFNLATDMYELGEQQAARDLARDTLERMRRVLAKTTLIPWRTRRTSLPTCAAELNEMMTPDAWPHRKAASDQRYRLTVGTVRPRRARPRATQSASLTWWPRPGQSGDEKYGWVTCMLRRLL